MRYTILTLFPGLIRPWLSESLLKKAQERGLIQVEVVDLRAYGLGRHRTVDDTPYGGGAGMVIRPDVAVAALEAVLPADEVILLSPAGEPFTQRVAEELAQRDHLVLLSGRYEGFDARVEAFVTRSLSIGDYVLMGGGGGDLGGAGGHRPAYSGGDRGSGKSPEGFLCPRAPGPPPLHPSPGVPRASGAGGSPFGKPPGGGPLAQAGSPEEDPFREARAGAGGQAWAPRGGLACGNGPRGLDLGLLPMNPSGFLWEGGEHEPRSAA